MRKNQLCLIQKLILLFTLFSFTTSAQTAEEIIDKHINAIGGKAKLAAINFYTYKCYDGSTIVYYKKPGKMRIEHYDEGVLSQYTVINGGKSWSWFNTGHVDQNTEVFSTLFDNTLPDYLSIATKSEFKIELIGVTKWKDYEIRLTPRSNKKEYEYMYTFYIDSDTWLIKSVNKNGYGVGESAGYENYTLLNGVKIPLTINFGEGEMVKKRTNVELNVPIDDKLFIKPQTSKIEKIVKKEEKQPKNTIAPVKNKSFKTQEGFVDVTSTDITKLSSIDFYKISFYGIRMNMTKQQFLDNEKNLPPNVCVKYLTQKDPNNTDYMWAKLFAVEKNDTTELISIAWDKGNTGITTMYVWEECKTIFTGDAKKLLSPDVINDPTKVAHFFKNEPIKTTDKYSWNYNIYSDLNVSFMYYYTDRMKVSFEIKKTRTIQPDAVAKKKEANTNPSFTVKTPTIIAEDKDIIFKKLDGTSFMAALPQYANISSNFNKVMRADYNRINIMYAVPGIRQSTARAYVYDWLSMAFKNNSFPPNGVPENGTTTVTPKFSTYTYMARALTPEKKDVTYCIMASKSISGDDYLLSMSFEMSNDKATNQERSDWVMKLVKYFLLIQDH